MTASDAERIGRLMSLADAQKAGLDGIAYNLTDTGNAERLVAMHGDQIRHVPAQGWYVWNGTHWTRDRTAALMRLAKQVALAINHDVANCEDDEQRRAIRRHAMRSESERGRKAMVALAATELEVIALAEDLDGNPWLLSVNNGTIDLRTGELHPHNPADLATKLAPVAYHPDASSTIWEQFIDTTTGGDHELARFLQRVVGYTLTGDTSEEVLLFAHGPTATGKSTFLEAIRSVLGEYGTTADFETFLRRRGDAGIRNDIARLAGARMVVSIEVDDGKQLAEGLIKALTGGDTVTARYLYAEAFEFAPQFKLWLCANHRPRVRADDEAMWRRIIQIPFTNTIPETQRDPTLKHRFKNDPDIRQAILAWAVQGCLAWQKHGLDIPATVRAYTAEYRAENDPLAEWINDDCQLHPDHWTLARDLRAAYERWAENTGTTPIDGGTAWGKALKAHECWNRKRAAGHGWQGIALHDPHDPNDP